jgi:hypothetical protein
MPREKGVICKPNSGAWETAYVQDHGVPFLEL